MDILIIEDDLSIADLERDYLDMSGFRCDIATTGSQGLKMALEGDYALIILDLMLPEMDGFDILTKIRQEKQIPVLIISAKGEDADKIRGLGLGADDYMVKPFSPSELVARVRARVSRYNTIAGIAKGKQYKRIVVKGLEIDQESRRVFLDGAEKVLTNKEFDLLVFLAENPDRVFSKELIFDRIWGMDALGSTSTVTVHIRRIREKIEPDAGSQKYIETVWGAGYRFLR